jgi:hypothetical protein
MSTFDDMRSRVRSEFLEMPGMRLKPDQVQRLCGLEQTMCDLVLESLMDAQFLYQTSEGAYARLTDGELFRPRAAHAHIITTVP